MADDQKTETKKPKLFCYYSPVNYISNDIRCLICYYMHQYFQTIMILKSYCFNILQLHRAFLLFNQLELQ